MKRNNYRIIRLEDVDSTNEYAKAKRAEGENLLILAKRQTAGKGTKGRSFSSEEGGVYLSTLTFYKSFPSQNAFEIMTGAAVAVCRTLKGYGFSPQIKWANDIFVDGKKIGGILIENSLCGGEIASSVVGIGLNVNNLLPVALTDIATSMRLARGREFAEEEVAERLIEELQRGATIEEYRSFLGYVGEPVLLDSGERAVLLGVTDRGELLVEEGEKIRKIYAGEVSIRV